MNELCITIPWVQRWVAANPGADLSEPNFFVGPNLNSNLSAEEAFSERTRLQSIEALKSQLEQLPRGATLFWMTHISAGPNRPKAARSEALGVPPPDMVKEIRGYTDALGLKLDL